VLVFVFYQFQAPPVVFNAAEVTRAEQSAEFRAIETRFNDAHAERRAAAIGVADQVTIESRQTYIDADKKFSAVRQEAVKYIRDTGDKNFNDVNYVFPTFVLQNMPMGVIGLIIAAIFAAAMSSISAELNALATATTIDFYRRLYKPEATDSHFVAVGRIATFLWGMFACVVAYYATNLGSLIEVVNKFGSFFYGSLLGVFVLAFVVKRARARGAFFGLLFGIASVWIASNYTRIEFLWFNVIGCLVTVAAGYLISLTVRGSAGQTPADLIK
jgi:Na+(H+)/acetate symporter ActP